MSIRSDNSSWFWSLVKTPHVKKEKVIFKNRCWPLENNFAWARILSVLLRSICKHCDRVENVQGRGGEEKKKISTVMLEITQSGVTQGRRSHPHRGNNTVRVAYGIGFWFHLVLLKMLTVRYVMRLRLDLMFRNDCVACFVLVCLFIFRCGWVFTRFETMSRELMAFWKCFRSSFCCSKGM